MTKVIAVMVSLLLILPPGVFAEKHGLTESMSRKSRLSTSTFASGRDSVTGVWQPETLHFADEVTGSERWRLTYGNRFRDSVGGEHGMDGVWSGDGSRIGGRHYGSSTNSTSQRLGQHAYNFSFLVSSDGSALNTPAIYASCDYAKPWQWLHTERSSAILTADTSDYSNSLYSGDELYKYTFTTANAALSSALMYNAGDNVRRSFQKNGLSGTDESIYLVSSDSVCSTAPNTIDSQCLHFFSLNATNATHLNSYGIARNAAEYAYHDRDWEFSWHSGSLWGVGAQSIDSIIIQYEGSGSGLVFFELSRTGSYSDGGPVWEDWDGDSYGDNEMRIVSSLDVNGTFPGYGNTYWGHPAFDNWGTKGIVGHSADFLRGNETDEEYEWKTRGTHIVEKSNNWRPRPGAVANKSSYDGSHHNWNAFSDYVLANQPSGDLIYTTPWTCEDGNATAVISLNRALIGGDYTAYPRPVQSPDGTKFVYHDILFYAPYDNATDDTSAYNINVAVAYYPHPPEITQVTSNSGTNTIRFDWRLDQANPRGYTTRGWPNEDTDNPPPPRETKEFRLWRSANGSNGWEPVVAVNATIFEKYNFKTGEWTGSPYWEISDTPSAGTWYYAVTSAEWSGLESRTLSNVYSSAGSQTAAYPSDPKGKSNFCTAYQSSIKRYYNIYAKDGSAPTATQAMRVASIPVSAEKEYIDWLGDQAGTTTQYLVTPVDSQGNEGEPLEGTRTPLSTAGQYLVAWTDTSGSIPVEGGESDPDPDPTPTTTGPIPSFGGRMLSTGGRILVFQ
jgi:hypothetical protein